MGGKVQLDLVGKIENGRLRVDQGVIAGCAGGTYDNLCDAAEILEGHSVGSGEYRPQRLPLQPAHHDGADEERGPGQT